MSLKAKVTIELDYDQKSLGFMLGKTISEDEFVDEVHNQVYEDIYTYLRSEPIKFWASMEITEDNK